LETSWLGNELTCYDLTSGRVDCKLKKSVSRSPITAVNHGGQKIGMAAVLDMRSIDTCVSFKNEELVVIGC